jgi:hypothetical protein
MDSVSQMRSRNLDRASLVKGNLQALKITSDSGENTAIKADQRQEHRK